MKNKLILTPGARASGRFRVRLAATGTISALDGARAVKRHQCCAPSLSFPLALALLSTLNSHLSTAHAQGSAFTYQGRLNDGANPANGNYEILFRPFGVFAGGSQLTIPNIRPVTVSNGLFTTTMDFGPGIFDGSPVFLQLEVRTNGAASYIVLAPRQPLTPAPYAIFAGGAGGPGITGAIPAAALGNAWLLNGNSNTGTSQFLGTTDDQPLDLRVNNTRVMRYRLNLDGTGSHTNAPNVIGGSSVNQVGSGVVGATIGGGGGNSTAGASPNNVGGDFGTVSGGQANTASGVGSFVGGGGYDGTISSGNLVNSRAAAIVGGLANDIPGGAAYAFIGGGLANTNGGTFGTISGGQLNVASGDSATVAGGNSNAALGALDNVGGGADNSASGGASAVGGGANNRAGGFSSIVAGGNSNNAGGDYSVISGGYSNIANAIGSFIGGGGFDGTNVIGNKAQSKATTIGGGLGNNILGGAEYSVIGGGCFNTNHGIGSVIGGGGYDGGFFFGGNQIYDNAATIGGGMANRIRSGAPWAVIGGGYANDVSGAAAIVPGGNYNQAGGYASFASGTYAVAKHDGSFVWSDSSSLINAFSSTAANQFSARAVGGVRFVTAVDSGGNATGAKLGSGDTAWSAISDRNAKKNLHAADGEAVLEKLAAIPIQFWNYKWESDTNTPHLGPMAQDFKAAFYPGRDDKSISTLEFDGVELAALQGLNRKLSEQEARLKNKDSEIQELRQAVAELQKTVRQLTNKTQE